ncbi:MAG: hypothetical protein M0R06_02115 [Sphaerochaeta sp.]|nr:hypothetical protein [Sphaerochaeta sp.]
MTTTNESESTPKSAVPINPLVPNETTVEQGEEVEGEEALGDAGKKALDRMKAELKTEKAKRIAAEQKAQDASATTEEEKKALAAQRERVAKANRRVIGAELRAAASGKLADPTDALAFIDLDKFTVDDDGEVDAQDIADAIEELITRKPHLAVQDGTKKVAPDPSQGATQAPAALNGDGLQQALEAKLGVRRS